MAAGRYAALAGLLDVEPLRRFCLSDGRAMVTEAELVARLRAAGCVFAEDEARLLMAAAITDEELPR